MDVFVARLPIFDKDKKVQAYELVFREGFEQYYRALGADRSVVDLEAIVSFEELTDGLRGLVPFSRELLLTEFSSLLSPETVMVGIPPAIGPDDQVVSTCEKLKSDGYQISMDHRNLTKWKALVLDLVDLFRIDFKAGTLQQRQTLCEQLERAGIRTVAQRVDTPAEFEEAARLGFSLFQGEFIEKPIINNNKQIPTNQINQMRVLHEINKPEMSYDEIAEIIKRDVSMTYQLLQLINSVAFGLRYEVNSIRHALVLLGPQEIRKWGAMLAVRGLAMEKPPEVLVRSLTRARVCEQIACMAGMQKDAPELFLVGMLSLIDVLTERKLEDALDMLPLSQAIRTTLLGGVCHYRTVFEMVLAYECGEWDTFSLHAAELTFDEKAMPELFRASQKWAAEAMTAPAGQS
ncbi:MAG: EAL and HDOD domain-containing protein [Phycisphaerae bacterium]